MRQNYKDGFTTKKWERFGDIYRANAVFTKINFQYSTPKGSQECCWYEGVYPGFHSLIIWCSQCHLDKKTWWTFPCIWRFLHLPHIYLQYGQRKTDTKNLLVTCRCPTFLPLIRFLSFNRAFAFFRLKNLPITILSWLLLFLERGSRWHPSITLASTSISDSLQMLITVFSRSSSGMLFYMSDSSTLFLRLYCSPFGWFFFSIYTFLFL